MKILLAVAAAIIAAVWLVFAPSSQLSPASEDPFPGIYSVIDPLTGMTQDIMKIEPFLEGEYHVFPRFGGERAWAHPLSAKVIGAKDPYLSEPLFPQDRKVSALSIEDIGYLFHTPGDSYSRDGRSDTGYLSHVFVMGIKSMHHRPLLAGQRERGERAQHDYTPKADDVKVSLTTLNYSARKIQVGISSVSNPSNAVDTDPLNPYMSSATSCCFYLPAKPDAPVQVNIESRWLPDGKLETRTTMLPSDRVPEELLVVVHADEKMTLEFRDPHEHLSVTSDGSIKSVNGRPYPALPVAERKAALAAELVRQKRFLDDITRQQNKITPETTAEVIHQLRDLSEERRKVVTYLKVFSECKADARDCDKQASAAARAQ